MQTHIQVSVHGKCGLLHSGLLGNAARGLQYMLVPLTCRSGDWHHWCAVCHVIVCEEPTTAGHFGEQWRSPCHSCPAGAVRASPRQWVSLQFAVA